MESRWNRVDDCDRPDDAQRMTSTPHDYLPGHDPINASTRFGIDLSERGVRVLTVVVTGRGRENVPALVPTRPRSCHTNGLIITAGDTNGFDPAEIIRATE
jgi:hypothetical protein